ncbi:MAG: adenylate kinase family protein [Halobacteriaceae archaeon]
MTGRVAVTGTPGTGKTTAVDLVETERPVVHLNDLVADDDRFSAGRDPERGSVVADLDALEEAVPDDALVESHLAHRLDAELVVVLRCHPDELARRLRERDEPHETVAENADSEALDVVLSEAVERHGADAVHEVDTTDREPEAVAAEVGAAIAGEREPRVGTVDFLDARFGDDAAPTGGEDGGR